MPHPKQRKPVSTHRQGRTSTRQCAAIGILMVFGVLLLSGCGSWVTHHRRSGFEQIQAGFDALPPTPGLYRVVVLDRVRVHIVGDRNRFDAPSAAAYGSPIVGYATRANEIWLFGKVVDGRIVLNQAVLGHELNHLLNFRLPQVVDPDSLDDLGL